MEDMFWLTRMPSVVYVLMVNATATMLFCFVISVIWQFTRNAMGFHTYQMVHGFVEDACTHHHVQSRAAFAHLDMEHSSRLMMVIGHMLSVLCGYRKLDLQTACFWNRLIVSTALQQLAGSLHAAFVNAVVSVPASSATRRVVTQHSMSLVPSKLAYI